MSFPHRESMSLFVMLMQEASFIVEPLFLFFACPKKRNQKKGPSSEEFFKLRLKTVWQTSRPVGPGFEALLRPILLKRLPPKNYFAKLKLWKESLITPIKIGRVAF